MSFLFANPYILGAILLALLTSHTGAFWWGYRTATQTYTIEKAEMRAASVTQREAELGKANVAATKLEADHAKTRVVFREITTSVDRVVERPVYRDVCLDPDGLLLANAALAGTGPAPAQPDSAVSGSHAP